MKGSVATSGWEKITCRWGECTSQDRNWWKETSTEASDAGKSAISCILTHLQKYTFLYIVAFLPPLINTPSKPLFLLLFSHTLTESHQMISGLQSIQQVVIEGCWCRFQSQLQNAQEFNQMLILLSAQCCLCWIIYRCLKRWNLQGPVYQLGWLMRTFGTQEVQSWSSFDQ